MLENIVSDQNIQAQFRRSLEIERLEKTSNTMWENQNRVSNLQAQLGSSVYF